MDLTTGYTDVGVTTSTLLSTRTMQVPVLTGDEQYQPCSTVIGLRTVFITFHSIFTILANIICIHVIRNTNTMTDSAKVFMVSLAISDLMVGVIAAFSIAPAFLGWWPWGKLICSITAAFVTVFCMTSVFSLVCISIDRIIAVCNPLRYHSLVTRRRALAATAFVWLGCFGIISCLWHNSPPVMYNNASVTCAWVWEDNFRSIPVAICICLSLFVVPCVILCVMYFKLLLVTQHHVRRITAVNSWSAPPTPRPSMRSSLRSSESSTDESAVSSGSCASVSDHKAVKMFCVITLAFTVAWAPYSITSMYSCISGKTIPQWSEFLVHWLAFSNSWFNVIVYVIMNTALRNTACRLLRRRHKRTCCRCGCCDNFVEEIPIPNTPNTRR